MNTNEEISSYCARHREANPHDYASLPSLSLLHSPQDRNSNRNVSEFTDQIKPADTICSSLLTAYANPSFKKGKLFDSSRLSTTNSAISACSQSAILSSDIIFKAGCFRDQGHPPEADTGS